MSKSSRLVYTKQNGYIPRSNQPSANHSPTSPISHHSTEQTAEFGNPSVNQSNASPEMLLRMRKLETFENSFFMVLQAMNDSMNKNEARLCASENRDYIKREWQQVALVVDRLLLFIFVLMTVGVTLGLLLQGTITYALPTNTSSVNL